MSIIEETLRRTIEQRVAGTPLEVLRPRPRLRRVSAAASMPPARRFQAAGIKQRLQEKNCIIPAVWDPAAVRAYKILRTRVLRRLEANDWHSFVMSGIAPGEGKTLTAVNLAIALAQDPITHVFLVDLDLQRPQVAKSLGLTVELGLSDYAAGKASWEDIVYESGIERLAVVPNAHPVADSSEFLASHRMQELLRSLEQEVPRRVLIFDMPPLLASDDVLAFAPQVDSLLLVVAEGSTKRSALGAAREILSEMNLLGVVLNRSNEGNEGGYY